MPFQRFPACRYLSGFVGCFRENIFHNQRMEITDKYIPREYLSISPDQQAVLDKSYFDSLKNDDNTKYQKYKSNLFNGIYYRSAPTRNPSSPAHAKAPPEDVFSEGAVPLFSFASDHSLRIKLLSSARLVLQVQRELPERPVLRVLQEQERRLLSCLSRLR